MKLRQLQCLCAVVDAGFNISRAATVLHATQPAVAKQLRLLEEELGAELFVRQSTRPVRLTEAGAHTEVWARRAMQCTENIRAGVRENQGESGGSIQLATSHAHAKYVLLPAIAAFNRRYPKVRIQVLQGQPHQVAELVHEGKVMLGVTHLPPELPNDLVAVPFMSSQRVVVAPPGHQVFEEPTLTLESLARYPIIVQRSVRPQGARIIQRFRAAGLEVRPAVESLDVDIVKSYAAAGLGVGIIPSFGFVPELDQGLRARDAGHLFEGTVSVLLVRRNTLLQKYVYAMLELVDPGLERRRLEALIFEPL
ncbi:MAG TPA: LysR substrate-binding domain-containing protein [Ramlibacter sp.]|nr:LysR substrate-binding domain-containing protein [Ramlibacter sp.]